MKIYNKIVMDKMFNVTEEDSYEYGGGIALCKGGSTAPPPPTAEEVEMTDLQIKILKDDLERADKMEPFILEAAGIGIDASGNYYKLPEKEDELLTAYKDRSLAALRGEDNISPALTKSLAANRMKTEQGLAAKLGPDWQQTTAGQQALSAMGESEALVTEESRRGAIEQGEGAIAGRESLLANLQQQQVSNLAAFGKAPGQEQFQSALNPFQIQRQAEFQGLVAKSQNKAAARSGQIGAGAAIAGAVIIAV